MPLDRTRDLELEGREQHTIYRRLGLVVLAAIVLAALFGVFGQQSTTSVASGRGAVLRVVAPQRLRGGLLFQGRFEIEATRRLADPRLVLSPGWLEAMTLNTVAPTPKAEASGPGGLSMSFEPIPAGRTLTVWTDWQVNPTNVGTHGQDAAVWDGGERLVGVDRGLTVFP